MFYSSSGHNVTDLTAVLGIDVGHLGAGQVPDDHAVTVAVEEGLPLGVLVHHDGLTSLRPRQSREREPVRDALA